MFTKTIAAFAILATAFTASAAPAVEARQSAVTATFYGATPEAQYTITIPTNQQFTATGNVLSISHLKTSGGNCRFYGVDGLVLNTYGARYTDVGPPQTIFGATCTPSY